MPGAGYDRAGYGGSGMGPEAVQVAAISLDLGDLIDSAVDAGEQVMAQRVVDFAELVTAGFTQLQVRLVGMFLSSDALGTVKLRIGGTDRAADGTAFVTFTADGAAFAAKTELGGVGALPAAGAVFVKLTGTPTGAGQNVDARDVSLLLLGVP